MSVEKARGLAEAKNGLLADGGDPTGKTGAGRDFKTMTVGQAFDLFLEDFAKPRLRAWKNYELQFEKHLGHWRTRRLSSVTRADVQGLHARIGQKHGHYAGNAAMRILRRVYTYAADLGYTGANPASKFKSFREQSRTRFLGAEELERFIKALVAWPETDMRDFFLLALLTGARKGNLASMRWEELDLAGAVWTIPAAKFKTGAEIRLPLVADAIEVLEARRAEVTGEWVFPSATSKSGHMIDPREALARICKAAEVTEELHIHDLRRTAGSWLAAGGFSLPIIGKALGHTSQSATAIYARLGLDPVRAALEANAAAMLEVAGIRTRKTEVVEVEKAGEAS
jgi:integrase